METYLLTQYNDDYIKITGFRDNGKKSKSKLFSFSQSKGHSQFCNFSRVKSNIKKIALCNDWDYFCTWTVSSKLGDRYSLEFCQNKMRRLMKAYKRKYKDFKFIYITEKHKDGAFHFHGLVRGLGSTDLYTNDNDFLSSHLFDTLGFNSFSAIKDINKCANYILKYITKECIKNDVGSIYFCSRGLSHGTSYRVEIEKADKIFPKENKNIYFDNGFCFSRDIIISEADKNLLVELSKIREKKLDILSLV